MEIASKFSAIFFRRKGPCCFIFAKLSVQFSAILPEGPWDTNKTSSEVSEDLIDIKFTRCASNSEVSDERI